MALWTHILCMHRTWVEQKNCVHCKHSPASLSCPGLLGAVALFLIQRNSDALVGRTMDPQRLKEIVDLLESDMVIQGVTAMVTLLGDIP